MTSVTQLLIPGLWAIEVADQHPSARVVGVDLALIQLEFVPSNCEFMIGDATSELAEYDDCSADLIHSRYEINSQSLYKS
jgi:hypothetical protein